MSINYRKEVGMTIPRISVKCSGRGCRHVQRIYFAPGRTGWRCGVCGTINKLKRSSL